MKHRKDIVLVKQKKMKYIFLLIIFFIYVSTINPTISKAKETVSINLSQNNVNVEVHNNNVINTSDPNTTVESESYFVPNVGKLPNGVILQ